MPGSVNNATPTDVLPFRSARRFSASRVREVERAVYADGRTETAVRFGTSRKAWELDVRLTADELDALRDFYAANAHKAFLFYDAAERERLGETPLYDETGAAPGPGKYTVRFDAGGGWRQEYEVGRGNAALRLVEVT